MLRATVAATKLISGAFCAPRCTQTVLELRTPKFKTLPSLESLELESGFSFSSDPEGSTWEAIRAALPLPREDWWEASLPFGIVELN